MLKTPVRNTLSMPFYSSFIYRNNRLSHNSVLRSQQEDLDCSPVLSLARKTHGYEQKYTHKFPFVFIVT